MLVVGEIVKVRDLELDPKSNDQAVVVVLHAAFQDSSTRMTPISHFMSFHLVRVAKK